MDPKTVNETEAKEESSDVPEPDFGSDSEGQETQESVDPECTDSCGPEPSSDSSDPVPVHEEEISSPKVGDAEGDPGNPTPDYSDDENLNAESSNADKVDIIKAVPEDAPDHRLEPSGDDALLIVPKKLVNPCLVSREHKALRHELKFNQKAGKAPTEKPELIRVLRERQDKEKKKELEEQQKAKRTSLEFRLEEQAQKLSQAEQQQNQEKERIKKEADKPEFFKVHSKISKAKLDS